MAPRKARLVDLSIADGWMRFCELYFSPIFDVGRIYIRCGKLRSPVGGKFGAFIILEYPSLEIIEAKYLPSLKWMEIKKELDLIPAQFDDGKIICIEIKTSALMKLFK